MKKTSFTFKLNTEEQAKLTELLRNGNYRPKEIPYTTIAVDATDCRIALYTSGKCLVQGKGAEDWVTFYLEPYVLQEVRIGYDEILSPEAFEAHMGIDESGKGDFFGPLVIAAAYVDENLTKALREIDVRDSKTLTSDKKARDMAKAIREILGQRIDLVVIGPMAYNRLYSSITNVNRLLAWGHARSIENLLEKIPSCPKAISDQFGPKQQIERALLKKGRKIELVQRHKAESDPAVAAASIIARAAYLDAMERLSNKYEIKLPKGASQKVQEVARELVKKHGSQVLLETAKCHFKTTDAVLGALKIDRSALGELGQVQSAAARKKYK